MDVGDILGGLWKARDFPTYWPAGFAKYWLIPLFLLALGPMLYFRFYDKSHRETYLVRQEHAERLRGLDREGFKEAGTLTSAGNSTDGTEPVQIRVRGPEQQADGSVLQHVALVYSDSVSRFSYAVLAGHAVWKLGSATAFEGPSPEGVALEDGLRRDFIAALVRESDKVVCIGLASSEPAPDFENTRLSDDRSINLCRALHNIGFADASRQQSYGLSIGEAPTREGVSLSTQRMVIIVGVINSRRLPYPRDIVQALSQLIQTPGARFDQYRRTGEVARYIFSNVGPGPLDGLASDKWEDLPSGTNPFAR